MKSLLLQEGQLKFNLFVPFEKSFQITEEQPEMPKEFASLNLESGFYVWGYASVQGVDLQGDMFPMDTLRQMAPGLTQAPYNKIFLNHDSTDIANGTIIATAMDDKGLLILAKLNEEHSRASEVWGSIQNQNLDGFSMGGSFLQVETIDDPETGMTFNVVREAIATEVSLTSAPVNGGSLIMGAFRKSREMFNKVEDKQFNKSLKIEMMGDDKKFFINKEFMKSMDAKKTEKYIKNHEYSKSMVEVKDLNSKQKELFDKAVSDGKTEDEALKLASALLDEQAAEGTKTKNEELAENPEKTGEENAKTKKKEMKKSVDEDSDEEVVNEAEKSGEVDEATEEQEKAVDEKSESEEGVAEEVSEESEGKEESKEEESPDESEELESAPEDYKEKYGKALVKIEQLESELNTFKKALPGQGNDLPEVKPLRKSVKTEQSAESVSQKSKSPTSSTPFLGWLKGIKN